MNHHYKVLIVGDSRVRFLEDRLNNTTLNLHFMVKMLPGADMHRIALKAMTESPYADYHLIILIGSVNNPTRLVRRPVRHIIPRFCDAEDLVNYTLDKIRLAVNRLRRVTPTPMVVSSLTGIKLCRYSPFYSDMLYGFQPAIDGAINQINCLIRGVNRINYMQMLDLSSHVYRCVGGGPI